MVTDCTCEYYWHNHQDHDAKCPVSKRFEADVLRGEMRLASLGDRPPSIAAEKLTRLIQLEQEGWRVMTSNYREQIIAAMGGRLTENDDAIINRLTNVVDAAIEAERTAIINHIRQFDYEEDWNLARGLVADIEAKVHLKGNTQ